MNLEEEEIDDLIEYKRLVFKLEDELKNKNSENSLLIKLNDDLKSLCKNIQDENEDLNNKLLSQYSEIKKINKKHQEEIKNINYNFDKQKEIYEEKIKKLSAYNPLNQKILIEKEIEMRYDEKIKTKNNEIEILNNKINYLEKENEDLKTEINNQKIINKKKILIENEEKNNLLNNLNILGEGNNNDNNFDTMVKELQDIIKNKEEIISNLSDELNKIREEEKDYEINIAKKYFFDIEELNEQKAQNDILQLQMNDKEKELNNICQKLSNLQKLVDEKCQTIEDLNEQNKNLQIKIKNKENEKKNEDEEIQKKLDMLRNLVQKYEESAYLNDVTNEKIKKKLEDKANSKIIQIQKEHEDEKSKLLSMLESNQINSNNYKNINLNINEEEKEENKVFKYEHDSNIFKIEYEKMKEKYNILLTEQKMIEKKMKNKEEENKYLNKCIKDLLKEENKKKINYKELKYKYKNLLQKKEHYKELCKIEKKNVENIILLLTPQQKEQIKKSENKYLIDTDSFSFTEIY